MRSNLQWAEPLRRAPVIGQLGPWQTGTEINSNNTGDLRPFITIYNEVKCVWSIILYSFLFFVHRRIFFTVTNEFCYTMYMLFWYASDVKYLENKTMHCHCRTDTSTTVDIHQPLETIGILDRVPGRNLCLLFDYPNLSWMLKTRKMSYGNYKLLLLNCCTKKLKLAPYVIQMFPALARVIVYL